jgi:hypothetical protein
MVGWRGHPIPEEGPLTSDTTVGPRVENGVDGANVDCTLTANGDGAWIDARLALQPKVFRVVGELQPAGPDEYSGPGTVHYAGPDCGALSSQPDACTLSVSPLQELSVSSGLIWASFDCPAMDGADTTAQESGCASLGSFAFERCKH